VVDGFEELTDEDLPEDECIPQQLVTYFEAYYIGCLRGRGAKQRRVTPSYPIETWNVQERTLAGMPRTNNPVEGFHNGYRSSLGGTNPTI
jgi:hypothetical protein